jgi:hypothetical protein
VLHPVHRQRVHVADRAGVPVDALHGAPLEVQEADQDFHDGVVSALKEAFGLAGRGLAIVDRPVCRRHKDAELEPAPVLLR